MHSGHLKACGKNTCIHVVQIPPYLVYSYFFWQPPPPFFVYHHSVQGESGKALIDRARLDRRRLVDAHVKYGILRVSKKYPQYLSPVIQSSLTKSLEEITPLYYKAFSDHYMGE